MTSQCTQEGFTALGHDSFIMGVMDHRASDFERILAAFKARNWTARMIKGAASTYIYAEESIFGVGEVLVGVNVVIDWDAPDHPTIALVQGDACAFFILAIRGDNLGFIGSTPSAHDAMAIMASATGEDS